VLSLISLCFLFFFSLFVLSLRFESFLSSCNPIYDPITYVGFSSVNIVDHAHNFKALIAVVFGSNSFSLKAYLKCDYLVACFG
jgi:hypothetical protein